MNLIEKYNIDLEEIIKIMRLQDWNIKITESNIDSVGAVTVNTVRNDSLIEINPNAIEDKKELVDTLFHEMIHIQFQQAFDFALSVFEELDSKQLTTIASNQFRELNERFTDNLARSLTTLYFKNDNEGNENNIHINKLLDFFKEHLTIERDLESCGSLVKLIFEKEDKKLTLHVFHNEFEKLLEFIREIDAEGDFDAK